MVVLVAVAVVAVIAIALLLDWLGWADSDYLRTVEWFRQRGAAVWWIGLSLIFIATGVSVLQLTGFVVLLYIAIVAVGIYDVDERDVIADLRAAWRKVRP